MAKKTINASEELSVLRDAVELIEAAHDLKARADRVGVQLPQSLLRMFGEETDAARGGFDFHPEAGAPYPDDMGANWMWIPASVAEVKTLVRAVLLHADRPVLVRDLLAELQRHIEVSAGTLANAGTQLQASKEIDRGEEGWELSQTADAPLLNNEWLFGPPSTFGQFDMAAWRRAVIRRILSRWPTGLQPMQIVHQLSEIDWLVCPKDKDIVKGDLEAMRVAKQIKRVSHSGKWVLTDRKEDAA